MLEVGEGVAREGAGGRAEETGADVERRKWGIDGLSEVVVYADWGRGFEELG
jgi:hypothetical protein